MRGLDRAPRSQWHALPVTPLVLHRIREERSRRSGAGRRKQLEIRDGQSLSRSFSEVAGDGPCCQTILHLVEENGEYLPRCVSSTVPSAPSCSFARPVPFHQHLQNERLLPLCAQGKHREGSGRSLRKRHEPAKTNYGETRFPTFFPDAAGVVCAGYGVVAFMMSP